MSVTPTRHWTMAPVRGPGVRLGSLTPRPECAGGAEFGAQSRTDGVEYCRVGYG